MKKIIAKIAVVSMSTVMAFTSLVGCNKKPDDQATTTQASKEQIVQALNKVLLTENGNVLTSSAEATENGGYSVVVITEDSATQYEVDENLNVSTSTDLTETSGEPAVSSDETIATPDVPLTSEEQPGSQEPTQEPTTGEASTSQEPVTSEEPTTSQEPTTSEGEGTTSSTPDVNPQPDVEDTTPQTPVVDVLAMIKLNVTPEQYAQIEAILTELGIGNDQLVTMLQAVYAETLAIAEINVNDVLALDYGKTRYFGQEAIVVKVKTASAKYEYTFSTKNYALYESEIKLNSVKPEVTEDTVFLTEAEATEIALKAIGATSEQVTNFKLKDDTHKAKFVYKIAFTFDGYDYSFKVNAVSKQIVKFEKEMSKETVLTESVETVKTKDEALAAVYAYLNIQADDQNLKLKKVKLDYEDGAFVYEIKLKLDGKEYEFEVSCETAEITDVDMDYDDDDRVQIGNKHDKDDDDHDNDDDKHDKDDKPNKGDHDDDDKHEGFHGKDEEFDYEEHKWKPVEKFAISEEEAVEKALAALNVENAFVKHVEVEKERVNGEVKFYYEVEIKANGEKYEYLVDVTTGEVTLETKEKHENKPNVNISEEKALENALNKSNFSKHQIQIKDIDYTEENGVGYYTVKFSHKGENYLFRINAQTGEVIVNE